VSDGFLHLDGAQSRVDASQGNLERSALSQKLGILCDTKWV